MTIQQAQAIVGIYETVLADLAHQKGLARCDSSLPCPKRKISIACRLVLAQTIKEEAPSDVKHRLKSAFIALAQFLPDGKAKRINSLHRKLDSASELDWDEYTAFIKSMTNPARVSNLKCFLDDVAALAKDDPCFWQLVDSLIGRENEYAAEGSWFRRVICFLRK